MSSPTLFAGRSRTNSLDLLLATIGIVVSVLLLGLRLIASQPYLVVIPVAIGSGSALYLLSGRSQRSESTHPTLSVTVGSILPGAVLIAISGLVVLTHALGTRTDLVYAVTGLIGVAIIGQILLLDEDAVGTGPLLVQILAAAIAIRLSGLYVTPGYVGVDIWTHATVFVDGIARQGSMAPLAESKYIMAPFYHAIGAAGALVLGSVRDGIYLTLGVLVPLSALFVYSTGRLVLPTRWALLGTALFAFSDQFTRWGMHIIPNSLGLVFFIAAFYFVTRVFTGGAERWAVVGLLGVSLANVFTHQVSTAVHLVFLGIAAFVAVIVWLGDGRDSTHRSRKTLSLVGVFGVTLVTTLVSWANTPFAGGGRFLFRELAVVRMAIAEHAAFMNLATSSGGDRAITTVAGQGVVGQLVPYIELVGFALLLAASVIGGISLVRSNASTDVALTYMIAAGGLFVAVFGLSLFGFRALLPGRWMAFLYVPMVLLGALGAHHLSRSGSRRLIAVAFVVLALGYPTTMVVAEKATLDDPAFDSEYERYSYTESEIAAVHTMAEIYPTTGPTSIATDHPYRTVVDRVGGHQTTTLELDSDGPSRATASVYRDYQASGPVTMYAAPGSSGTVIDDDLSAAVCPASWNKMYANDAVWLCTSPTEGS